jgi:hypothetical protein
MPNAIKYIGAIKELTPLSGAEASLLHAKMGSPVKVVFGGGQSALLDTSQPRAAVWAKLIDLYHRDSQPIYVEVAEGTGLITRLCAPISTRVLDIYPTDGETFEIGLYKSDALHTLSRSSAGFEDFYNLLQQAKDNGTPILVTATPHDFEIIDVRQSTQSLQDKVPGEPLPPPMPIIPVSQERAVELFNMVSTESCTTDWLASPCLTFKYPGSGCNVRAHLMCLMMIKEGATPEKIWISPKLTACTTSVPKCEVGWAWHVAPTLMVEQPIGPPIKMVIDPSLCDKPVTEAYWKSLMGNTRANLHPDRWELYEFPAHGTATPEEAEAEMQKYRGWLADMWASNPPPYKCAPCQK